MEEIQLQAGIVGLVLPFIISFAKRYIKLDGTTTGLLTMAVCVVVTLFYAVVSGTFDPKDFLGSFITIYGVAQIVYKGLMKPTGIDTKLEK